MATSNRTTPKSAEFIEDSDEELEMEPRNAILLPPRPISTFKNAGSGDDVVVQDVGITDKATGNNTDIGIGSPIATPPLDRKASGPNTRRRTLAKVSLLIIFTLL